MSLFSTPLEFFTSALGDGFSLEFKRQQVSSSLQESLQYSGRSFTSALGDGFSLEFKRQQVSSSLQESLQYSGRS